MAEKKIHSHYGDRISVTELPGKNSVLNFKGSADNMLYEKYEDEHRRIVEKAAHIIKEDINTKAYEMDTYPSAEESSLNANLVPDTLIHFLETIVTTKANDSSSIFTKHKPLGQAIVAACRPKTLSPILLGVGVYVHCHYGSRQLEDLLSSIGFSVSYNDILRYANCVIAHETGERTYGDGEYIQFSFDNSDFNVRTMTGHATFHSVGGVMMSTAAPQVPEKSVPRNLHLTAAAVTAGHGYMDIAWYQKPAQLGLKKVLPTVASTETKVVLEPARALEKLQNCTNAHTIKWSG